MNTIKPVRKPGIIVQDLGEEVLLCSPEAKAVHILNHTAQRIWELCDGAHTVEDMEQDLRVRFAVSAACHVTGDICLTLEVFASKGLLKETA